MLLAFGAGEILLRIHNPFAFRVKADRISLPINQRYALKNTKNKRLPGELIHTKNSLGFRGEDPPVPGSDRLKIIAVGGSTTECFYLSDGRDWPNQLGSLLKPKFPHLWLNNAGIDGHSTFGHQILLDDYLVKLKPNIILFLVGFNDVGLAELNRFERSMLYESRSGIKRFLFKSEMFMTIINVWRALGVGQQELRHRGLDLAQCKHISSDAPQTANELKKYRDAAIQYEARIRRLIETCQGASITPVFITQPALYGKGTDDVTGVNLETVAVTAEHNGKTQWLLLEEYNEATKETCRSNSVACVDLANLLPKSSTYFYDWAHYTEAGAKKVAEIVEHELFAGSNLLRYAQAPQKAAAEGDGGVR